MFTWWQGILAVIATIVIYLIVVFVSSHTGGVQVWLDGTLLPLGIVGQILMTYGYRSQWVAWIILDVIKVVIWFNQLSAGGPGAMSMFVLQVVMLANGFYGAWVWFHKSSTMTVSDDLQSSICTESIIANGGR
ncbi:MAG: nicotinamide riboside transporter PnuC [Bifidobacterium pseudocatenulatum]